jgi:succinate dehydrogenase/fumarate reductase flavoprotein subunit
LAAEAINAHKGQCEFEPSEAVLQKHLQNQQRQMERFVGRRQGTPYGQIRDRLRSVCSQHVGIFRSETALAEAVAGVQMDMYDHATPVSPSAWQELQRRLQTSQASQPVPAWAVDFINHE